MKTTLDKCYGIILDNLNYQNEGELTILVTELITSESKTNLDFGNGKMIKDVSPVESTADSKHFKIEFKEIVFHQVIDESYCVWDEYEIRDGKDKIQVLEKSRYMDFINENFPFYSALEKKGKHYRINAMTEIIDIIAYDEPEINELKN